MLLNNFFYNFEIELKAKLQSQYQELLFLNNLKLSCQIDAPYFLNLFGSNYRFTESRSGMYRGPLAHFTQAAPVAASHIIVVQHQAHEIHIGAIH